MMQFMLKTLIISEAVMPTHLKGYWYAYDDCSWMERHSRISMFNLLLLRQWSSHLGTSRGRVHDDYDLLM